MQKPSTCRPCALHQIGTSFSRADGKGKSGVIIVGEALGHEEAIDGVPFRPFAQAGSKIKECYEELGLERDDFIWYNIIACQPPGNRLVGQWYEAKAISCCSQYRTRVIDDFVPPNGRTKVILALGNTAFQTLTGNSASVLDVAGYPFQYANRNWQETHHDTGTKSQFGYDPNVVVVGSLHPSYIKRGNPHLTPLLTYDLLKAISIAKGLDTFGNPYISPQEYRKKKRYKIVGHDDARAFANKVIDNPRLVVAHDVETAESGYVAEDELDKSITPISDDIIQIQFALDKFNAVIFPSFDGLYLKLAKRILESQNLKANHNAWNFDNPRYRKYGIEIDEKRNHDTMWMFKQWHPKLPRGLQRVAGLAGFPFAWKHLFGVDLEEYGGADVCSIHFVLEWLPKLMKSKTCVFDNETRSSPNGPGPLSVNVYQSYHTYVYKLHPHLHDAAQDGFPVSEDRRQELDRILRERRKRLDSKIQKIVPDEIKNLKPCREKEGVDVATGLPWKAKDYGYLREPKEKLKIAADAYSKALQICERTGKKIVGFDDYVRIRYNLSKRCLPTINPTNGERDEENRVDRWCVVEPFKSSKEQLSRYILYKKHELIEQANKVEGKKEKKELARLAGLYAVPTDHKGKETTNKTEIEILFDKTGDEVLQMNLEDRSLRTNITNYIPNWKPNSKTGCVHTTWGFTAASGQLDSRAPNVLNCSKHTEVGQEFRRIIEAPDDYLFLELDKKSFHVATMGYVANSANYIRFSQIDPHSIFTSWILPEDWNIPVIDMEWDDEKIKAICKEIKSRCKELVAKTKKVHDDIRQFQAKPTVLGNQLGLGPDKLYWQNRRSISGIARAKELQTLLGIPFPEVEQCKIEVKKEAEKKRYLMNEFGYIQWFYDVVNYRWNKSQNTWKAYDGDEARGPIAFRVQGCAFGMIKDELFRILEVNEGQAGAGERAGSKGRFVDLGYRIFRSSIHDSLVFMIKKGDLDRVLPVCIEEMSKPCGKLVNEATGVEGLKVGVEWSKGRNLQNYDKDRNVEGMKEG